MKKLILLLIALVIMSASLLAIEKVALIGFAKMDKKTAYVVKQLPKDFKDILAESAEYEFIKYKDTLKLVKAAGIEDVLAVTMEQLCTIGAQSSADIIVWGSVSSISTSEFNVTARVMNIVTKEPKTFNLTVEKSKKKRREIIKNELIAKFAELGKGLLDKQFNIAIQQYQAKNYAGALQVLEPLAASTPDNKELYPYLSYIYMSLNNYDKCIAACQKGLELDPQNYTYYRYLGATYLAQANFEEAINNYNTAAEKDNDKALWMKIAKIYSDDLEDMDTAIETYQHVIDNFEDNLEANKAVAELYYDSEQYEDAIAYFQNATALDPHDETLTKKLAACYTRTGNLDSAIENMEAQLANDPDNAQTYLKIAKLYAANKQANKAIENLLTLKNKGLADFDVIMLLANSYLDIENFTKAEKHAKEALKMDDKLHNAYLLLADIYLLKGYKFYDKYNDLVEKSNDRSIVGTKKDKLIDDRNAAKAKLHGLFVTSGNYLNKAKPLATSTSVFKSIQKKKKALTPLLEQTEKSFFE